MTAATAVTFADLAEPWPADLLPPLDREPVPPDPRAPDLYTNVRASWVDNGVAHFPGLIDAGTVARYSEAWLAANADRPGGWPYDVPYMHHPAVRDLVCHPALDAAMSVLFPEPMGVHLNLSGWRSTTRNWHPDGYLNPDHVADWYVAAWVALDDIHPDAGPFQFVPGSHRWPETAIRQSRMLAALAPHERGPDWPRHSERILTPLIEQLIADRDATVVDWLPKRGDVLLWHARLLHRGSTPVDVLRERRALIAHYSGIHHRPDMPAARQVPGGGWFFPIEQTPR